METWQLVKRVARGVVKRRKTLVLVTFLLAALLLAPVGYYFSREGPRYQSAATILLETRPDRVPIFEEFSPVRPFPVQLAILNSRHLAEGVLENLPRASFQDLLENPYYVDYALEIKNLYRRLVGVEPEVESPQRRALKELLNARVSFVSRANAIVQMTAEAAKPQVAVDILNTYIEVLLSRTRSFNIDDARVTREFLEQQVAESRKNLDQNEEALRAFTVAHGGIRVPEQSWATLVRLTSAENTLAEVVTNRKIVEARVKGFREKAEAPKSAPPGHGAAPSATPAAPSPAALAVQRLREQLARLEAALFQLRTKYTDEHPRVILVKDQIAQLQRELSAVVKEVLAVAPLPAAVPPAERPNFAEQVVALETAGHALAAREEGLRKEVEGLRQSLSGLSRTEIEYSRLVREVESSRSVYSMLSDKLTAARIREQGEMKVVKVIDPPGFALPVVLSKKRLVLLGLALALTVGFGIGIPSVVEYVKRPVEFEVDVESAVGLPVLAAVPRLRSQDPLFLSAEELRELGHGRRVRDHYLFAEAFRNLRVGVQLAARRSELRTLLVTSALPREGKSMVVVNLGLAFSEAGRRVVLADTDILRPRLHELLDVGDGTGLVDVLHARREVEHALVRVSERMWLAPRGSELQPATRGMLATSRLRELLEKLLGHGDVILCDSSPVLLVPDNLFLAAAVDGVILVVRTGHTSGRDLARAKSALERVGARLVGVVLNEARPTALEHRYYRRYLAQSEA